jgi:hypothetical protein
MDFKDKDETENMLKNFRTPFYKPSALKSLKNKVLNVLFLCVWRKSLRTLLNDQYCSTLFLLGFLHLLIKHLKIWKRHL